MKKTNNHILTFLLSLIFVLSTANLFGQKPNAYKFIEPNISISYDSNRYQITNHYSNTTYETASYDFEYKPDTVNKVNINIKADHPIHFPPRKTLDSLILLGLADIKEMQNDSFALANHDQLVRDINGFACLGFVVHDKITGKYTTVIGGSHLSDNDNTEVKFLSANKNDLEADYEILKDFLNGFKTYTKAEIAEEDRLIKNKYAIITLPTNTVSDKFQGRPMTFTGIVKTKTKLLHNIKEVRLTNDYGQEIFLPNPDGTVSIISYDKEKGEIIKEATLVLLNSFGKNVLLPFTFTYINNGPR
jgi:hypothetical protein